MPVEREIPVRDVRDNLADVIEGARAGTVTYVTRRGERVAAVVPLGMARSRPATAGAGTPARALPAAAGGRFPYGEDGGAGEEQWNRAALEAMHLRIGAAMGHLLTWQRITGQALAAAGASERGALEQVLDGAGEIEQAASNELGIASDLLYALIQPDDAYCLTCSANLGMFHGTRGWRHWHEVPGDYGTRTELYTPDDGHEPKVRYRPRLRAGIVDGLLAGDASELPS